MNIANQTGDQMREAGQMARRACLPARTRLGFYRLSRHALSEWYNE